MRLSSQLMTRRTRPCALAIVLAVASLTFVDSAQANVRHHIPRVPFFQLHWRPFRPAGRGGSVGVDGPYLFVENPKSTRAPVLDTTTGVSFNLSTPPGEATNQCGGGEGGDRELFLCYPPGDLDDATLWEFIFASQTWQQVPTTSGEFASPDPEAGAPNYTVADVGTVWADFETGYSYPGGGVTVDKYVRLTTGAVYDGTPVAPERSVVDLNAPQFPYMALCTPLNTNDFMEWITPHTALMYGNNNKPDADTNGPLYVQSCGSATRQRFSTYYQDLEVNDSLMVEVPSDGAGESVSHARLRGYDGRTGEIFELSAPPTGGIFLAFADDKIYASPSPPSDTAVEVATLPASLRSATSPTPENNASGEPLTWSP